MRWLLLGMAIALEVCGEISVKLSQGFSRATPSVLVFVFYGLSFVSFIFAVKWVPLSVAYAIWSGVGIVSITIIGALLFREGLGAAKVLFIALIIAGVVGLQLTGRR
ncbi:MAG: multidrug efflux SMR transporter [Dehalococcoidia bacterium]|nr:multidrug efflux SMR transporter [Dehalococcoidia bacterium]